MMKRVFLFGMALTTMLAACGGEPGAVGDENVSQAKEALTSCNAPVNALADWIDSTRTSTSWCVGCSYVSVAIHNSTTGASVLNWYAGIDHTSSQYFPPFCWMGICTPAHTVRTISGTFYGSISADSNGTMFFPAGGTTVQLSPESCSADANGTLTITGSGSDGEEYTVVLTETWFS